MVINVDKTKVMLFGDSTKDVSVKIHNKAVENVHSFKYLGVVLDTNLDFGMQVDYAVGKAKRALAKICMLIKGRQGISVKTGVDLYKSLVRRHLEYAIPSWANISEQNLAELESAQSQCLKWITGAKTHSASSAVKVVCGTVPIRFRERELCNREYIRILTLDSCMELKQSMASSFRVGLKFCPLEYLKVISCELHRRLDVSQRDCSSSEIDKISITRQINTVSILDDNTTTTSEKYNKATAEFISTVKSQSSLLVFTDGSVCGDGSGCGACAAVLYTPLDDSSPRSRTRAVGTVVNSLECEIEGILLGIELVIKCIHD